MVKEAEANKAADDKRKEEVELRNRADSFIAQIDNMLEDNKDKIGENEKAELTKTRDDLQKALDENNMSEVQSKLNALEKAAQMAAQAMNQQQANPNAGQSDTTNNNNSGNDDVVDGEFTEK